MVCVNNIYFGGKEEIDFEIEPLEIEVQNVKEINQIKNKVKKVILYYLTKYHLTGTVENTRV